MHALSVIILLVIVALPIATFAEIQTFTATHTYILGDHDSKDDARQRCLLETKRKILEQAGVYIESSSEVKNFDLTKDKITSFAAAFMQVKDTKETVGFENGHMMLTIALTAIVDSAEVQKLLVARQIDMAMQERLKRLEAQFEAMQQHTEQPPKQAPDAPVSNISAINLQEFNEAAAKGNKWAQYDLGMLHLKGRGVPQNYVAARQWLEKSAAQGHPAAQCELGILYTYGNGVPQDYATARQWFEKSAAQRNAMAQFYLGWLYASGLGGPKNLVQAHLWLSMAARGNSVATQERDKIVMKMTPAQIAEAHRIWQQCENQGFRNC